MTKKSLRLLITTDCNFSCSYCCNNLPEIKERFKLCTLDDICNPEFTNQYSDICLTGGEPLLNIGLIKQLCEKLSDKHTIFLYTNGEFLTMTLLNYLSDIGISKVNIGLHENRIALYFAESSPFLLDSRIRFSVEDIHISNYLRVLETNYPGKFTIWRRNECKGKNEDWYILIT